MKSIDTSTIIELGMSNCDHSIDEGLEEALQEGSLCQYSGWNFCGYVWFEDGRYICQVWCHKSPREEILADTLKELMEDVSSEYGYE